MEATTTTTTSNGISTRKLSDQCHAVTYGREFLKRLRLELATKGTFTVYYHSLPSAKSGEHSHRVFFDKQKAEHSV